MKVLAVNASPNKDGLTAVCAEAVLSGAQEAGAQVEWVHLCDLNLYVCGACDRGWGKCRTEGPCVLDDDFAALREQILAADAWVLATPVYFGEPSEIARVLLDRLRRCNSGPQGGQLRGKEFLGICAAGGSGRGTGTCAEVLERISGHVGMRVADLILVTRRSKLYKVDTLKAAGRALVEQEWNE
ncbi:flavodoxin family protein [bacterium]|nr:flavodoxin family protein [bacterium]